MQLPLLAIYGGLLIGVSAVLLLLFNGRIAGISGIVWGSIKSHPSDRLWRICFLIGLPLGALLMHQLASIEQPPAPDNFMLAAIAGVLVGMGVKIGNGCTSGHGVCGIGRLSKRSIVATITFMSIAIITVAVMPS